MKSPTLVPLMVVLVKTLSPSAIVSCTVSVKPENDSLMPVKNWMTPALVGGMPGTTSCSTRSSAISAARASRSPALIAA